MSRQPFNQVSSTRLDCIRQVTTVAAAVLALAGSAVAVAAPNTPAKAASKPSPVVRQAGLRVVESCNWDKPGSDALVNMIPPTVDNFTDIPAEVRKRLIKRMDRQAFDDFVLIRRDSISSGKHRYDAQISGMQFGNGTLCKNVKRTNWSPTQVTRALIYCESGTCILVPTELRNVARVKRLPPTRLADATPTEEPDLLDNLPPTAAGPGGGAGGAAGGSPSPAFPTSASPAFEQVASAAPNFAGLMPTSLGSPIFGLTGSGGGNTDTGGGSSGGGGSTDTGGGTGTGGGTSGGGTSGGGSTGGSTDTGSGTGGSTGGSGSGTGGSTGTGTGSGGGNTGGSTGGNTGGTDTGGGGNTGGGTLPPVTAVPEPGVMALWAAGLATLLVARRRRPRA